MQRWQDGDKQGGWFIDLLSLMWNWVNIQFIFQRGIWDYISKKEKSQNNIVAVRYW